jgi:hypothetical protein
MSGYRGTVFVRNTGRKSSMILMNLSFGRSEKGHC